jgi:hypothetical protein
MIKSPLDLGDIGTINIPKTIKSSVKNLPVMVTEQVHKRDGVRYNVCTKHGHVTGTFSRSEIAYRKHYNKDIVKIDPTVKSFKNKLTLQQACHEFSNVIGCNCVTDCASAPRCSCRLAGVPCTTLCHKGRGKNKLCTLFADLCCSDQEEEKEEKEEEKEGEKDGEENEESFQLDFTQVESTPI